MTQFYNSFWRRNLLVCFIGSFSTVFAMTLMLPFLPLYVEELGVSGHAAVVQWSGVAFSATFISAGLIAPVWGKLGDRYGRKSMLVRASLGMAVTVSLMGLVTNIGQLVGLRLLVGLAGGYSSGATILIAVQAPRERAAWALGIVSSGVMAGNLIGPLAGGWLPGLIGIRTTFFFAGALIFLSFIMTLTLIREEVHKPADTVAKTGVSWSLLPARTVIICMLCTGLLLMLANMSRTHYHGLCAYSGQRRFSDNESGGICDGSCCSGQHYFRLLAWKTGGQDRTFTHYHAGADCGRFTADPSGICHLRVATGCPAFPYGTGARRLIALYCSSDTSSCTRRYGGQRSWLFRRSAVCWPVHRATDGRLCRRAHRYASRLSGNQLHPASRSCLEL